MILNVLVANESESFSDYYQTQSRQYLTNSGYSDNMNYMIYDYNN